MARQTRRVRGDDGRLDRGPAVLHRRARGRRHPHGGGRCPHRGTADGAVLCRAPPLRGQAPRRHPETPRADALRAGRVSLHARARGGLRTAWAPRRSPAQRRRAYRPLHARPARRRCGVLRARRDGDLHHQRAIQLVGFCVLLSPVEPRLERVVHRALPREVGAPSRRSRHEGGVSVVGGASPHPPAADPAQARARVRLALGPLARALGAPRPRAAPQSLVGTAAARPPRGAVPGAGARAPLTFHCTSTLRPTCSSIVSLPRTVMRPLTWGRWPLPTSSVSGSSPVPTAAPASRFSLTSSAPPACSPRCARGLPWSLPGSSTPSTPTAS